MAIATEKKISHVALYLRISQEKKSENVETLANHRQLLKEYCKDNGYTYEEFGEVISGGKTELEERKALHRLLDNIEKFDGVLVVELSRISRNGLISQTVKQYCIDYDKPILTPFQTYDLANNETDRLMFDVGSMMSSHEHGIIGKRSKTNKKQMAKQGLHISGSVPFGYRRNDKTKRLEIFEPEADIVRYIFKLHSQGLGSFKIRDILNEEGYKPSRSNHWNLPSIKRIIRNETYSRKRTPTDYFS
jgi:DNA invertase Pin-like site-specific DNA recombinase